MGNRFNFLELKNRLDVSIWRLFLLLWVLYVVGIFVVVYAVGWALISLIEERKYLTYFHNWILSSGWIWILVAATVAVVLSYFFTSTSTILRVLGVVKPDLEDNYHKRFVQVIEEVKIASGKHNIEPVIIPDSGLNAFACQGWNRKMVIGVTEGLLAKLSRRELEAVVAHEMGHLVAGDLFATTMFCSISSVYSALRQLGLSLMRSTSTYRTGYCGSRRRSAGGQIWVGLVLFVVASVWSALLYVLVMAISRRREYRADALAVKIVRDPESLASALIKIKNGYRDPNLVKDKMLAALFAYSPFENNEKEGWLSNLFSTHPPIDKRIEILCGMASLEPKMLEKKILREERKRLSVSRKSALILEDEESQQDEDRWWVFLNGSWQGPYYVGELATMGLSVDVFVRKDGEENVTPLGYELRLRSIFVPQGEERQREDILPMCPKCGDLPLVRGRYEGSSVLVCKECGGILVNSKELQKIILRVEMGFSDDVKGWGEKLLKLMNKPVLDKIDRQNHLLCPICTMHRKQEGGCSPKQTMRRQWVAPNLRVEVDVCRNCGAIWFDFGELEVLQYVAQRMAEIKDVPLEKVCSRIWICKQ